MTYVEADKLKPLKVVVNAGNGGAGEIVDRLEPRLPLRFVKLLHEPDGSFPNGVPNPCSRTTGRSRPRPWSGREPTWVWHGTATSTAASCSTRRGRSSRATTSSVSSLAELILGPSPRRAKIVHDPRLTWNTDRRSCVRPAERAGAVQERPRVHQGGDATRGRRLRRGDVRAPLLSRVRLLPTAA